MSASVAAKGCDGGGNSDDEEDDDCDSEEFHVSMFGLSGTKKQWQKCPIWHNFCHNDSMLKKVAVIVVPHFSIFEFGTAYEVFGIDRSGRDSGVPAFDFRVCTPVPGNVPMKSGLSMYVEYGLEAAADADLVIMAPYGRDEDVSEAV